MPKGHRVVVTHFRRVKVEEGFEINTDLILPEDELLPRGGATVAKLYAGKEYVGEGWSFCGRRDNYNKRIGRDIAVGRLLKDLETQGFKGL